MRFRSQDGLCESADPAAVALWDKIGARMDQEQRNWSLLLQGLGVKAEHPDDGWVKGRGTGDESVHFSYARFNLGPKVGDLIALGAPYHSKPFPDDPKGKRGIWRYRLVRVTSIEDAMFGSLRYYHFEDTGRRLTDTGEVPERLPARPWWRRWTRR